MDMYRQCCLDLMLGTPINLNDILTQTTIFNNIRTVGNIANELIPLNAPSYIPELAFGVEIQLANAMYYMARLVNNIFHKN